MKHPLEICLTACEWLEERRGRASARKALNEEEEKTLFTFLSQGAVAGALVYFLAVVFIVVWYRDGYNFFLLIVLPFFLVFGSLFGSITAVFVWLPEWIFKRRFRFAARAAFGIANTSLLSIASIYLMEVPDYQAAFLWSLPWICGLGLAVALVTGSDIKPCRMLVFGAGRRGARRHVGNWISIPFGFLLRAASVLGLLEALMAVAVWISDRTGHEIPSAPPEHLPAIALTVLYFAISSYLSVKTPGKFFLLPTAILLNLPLAALIVHPGAIGISGFLVSLGEGFICLWAIYSLGRVITPESASGADNSGVTVVRLDYSGLRI